MFLDFIVKAKSKNFRVCVAPSIRPLENHFQLVLQLAPASKDFVKRT